MNINEFHPTSGRFVKEDGATVNIADALGGKSVNDKVYDIDNMMPHSGRFIKEDGTTVNIADMIANGDIGGGGGSDSGSSDDSAPPIVETYNGQTIQCSMSADRPLQGLNLYATCEQQTYSGKNLFNKETIEDGVVNASGQLDSSEVVKTSDFIKVKPSTQYKSTFNNAYVKFYTSEKEPVQTENVDITTNSQKFTTGESTEYIRYSFNFTDQAPETLIITKGTNELTPYEPYVGGIPSPNGDYPQEIQTISNFVVEVKNSMGEVTTPQTLNVTIPEQGFYGIPVSDGGNYTDSSGQQWVCDEFDYKRGKHVQRVAKYEFCGNEAIFLSPGGYFNFDNLISAKVDAISGAMCNCYRYLQSIQHDNVFWINSSGTGVRIRDTSFEDAESFKVYIANKFDNRKPITLIYPIATPIETDLSKEQVEQFKQLHCYKGFTVIENNATPACNMIAEIIVDTKLYIDEKIGQIATQMLGGV